MVHGCCRKRAEIQQASCVTKMRAPKLHKERCRRMPMNESRINCSEGASSLISARFFRRVKRLLVSLSTLRLVFCGPRSC